ncbi:MAG: 30S ribosomal protein S6 [Bacteroidota bacterium]
MPTRYYETTFILKSVLSETEATGIIDRFRNFLIAKGAEIIREKAIGLRPMAYPIKAEDMGIYHRIEYKARPEIRDAFIGILNQEDRVLRYMSMILAKDRVDYDLSQSPSDLASQTETE